VKRREGFVSNSSSSSFVCAVSGRSYEGYDGEYDVDHCTCEYGHEFCGEYLVDAPQGKKELTIKAKRSALLENTEDRKMKVAYANASDNDIADWYVDSGLGEDDEDTSEVHADRCPICSFTYGEISDLLTYLLHKNGITEETLLQEVKEKYGTYKSFRKAWKNMHVLKSR
jgi:hypothetical protein